jgi:hypothetical protein
MYIKNYGSGWISVISNWLVSPKITLNLVPFSLTGYVLDAIFFLLPGFNKAPAG